MATRRERYLKLLQKHKRRRNKAYDRGKKRQYFGHPTEPGRFQIDIGRRWSNPRAGKCDPLNLRQSSYTYGPLETFDIGDVTREVNPAAYRRPAVPFLWGAFYDELRLRGIHPVESVHGYHRRRVTLVKYNPNRMKGAARYRWVANQIYVRHGYFPDTDPDGRRPNYSDVLNGTPAHEDPVWPG